MRSLRRKHRIRQIGNDPDGPEYELRLNDHVTVEWTIVEGDPQINLAVSIGDLQVVYYITTGDTFDTWMIHDLYLSLGEDHFFDQENLDLYTGPFPTTMTWLKMAREKGAFK